MIDETLLPQLAAIKYRLETYSFSHHEAKILGDCLLILIRTVAGEELTTDLMQPPQALQTLQGESVVVGGQVLHGGQEIAPGVVTYPVNQAQTVQIEQGQVLQPALIDVNKNLGRQIQPVPGSLMAAVQGQAQGQAQPEVAASSQQGGNGVPPGVPSPGDTKVEVSVPNEGDSNA